MFTKVDLIEQSASFIKSTTPIESILFEPDDFPSSSSEETISFCRGLKSDFESPIHFWIRAQHCVNWAGREEFFLPYIHTAVCQPESEPNFMNLLNRTQGLRSPIIIVPRGNFMWGQLMMDEWNDTAAIAEFEYEYISFHWDTTA
jgi:hypothetical protein